MNAVSPLIQRAAALLILALVLGFLANAVWLALAYQTSLEEEIAFLQAREAQLMIRAAELDVLRAELDSLEKIAAREPAFTAYENRKEAEDRLHRTLRDLAQATGLQLIHLRPLAAEAETGPIKAQVQLRGRENAVLDFAQKLLSGPPPLLVPKFSLSLGRRRPDPANILVQVEAEVELVARIEAR